MALKSGEMAGLSVRPEVYGLARRWLVSVSAAAHPQLYAYQPGHGPSSPMTAEARLRIPLRWRDMDMLGHLNQAVGNTKETLGHAVGNPRLENEGLNQQAHGNIEQTAGKQGGKMQGLKDRVAGGTKEAAGKLTGNVERQTAGQLQKEQGKVEAKAGKHTDDKHHTDKHHTDKHHTAL